jgi:hypothetical protein
VDNFRPVVAADVRPEPTQWPPIIVTTDDQVRGIAESTVLSSSLAAMAADAHRSEVRRVVVVRIAIDMIDMGLALACARHSTTMLLASV